VCIWYDVLGTYRRLTASETTTKKTTDVKTLPRDLTPRLMSCSSVCELGETSQTSAAVTSHTQTCHVQDTVHSTAIHGMRRVVSASVHLTSPKPKRNNRPPRCCPKPQTVGANKTPTLADPVLSRAAPKTHSYRSRSASQR
jgi:hypothetical protein